MIGIAERVSNLFEKAVYGTSANDLMKKYLEEVYENKRREMEEEIDLLRTADMKILAEREEKKRVSDSVRFGIEPHEERYLSREFLKRYYGTIKRLNEMSERVERLI